MASNHFALVRLLENVILRAYKRGSPKSFAATNRGDHYVRVGATETRESKGSTQENQAFQRSAADCVLALWRSTRPRAKRRAVVFGEGPYMVCAAGVVETHGALWSRVNRRFAGAQ